MERDVRFLIEPLRSGLWKSFRSNSFLTSVSVILIVLLSSIIPLSFVRCSKRIFFDEFHFSVSELFLDFWASVEVIFFFYQLRLFYRIQGQTAAPHLTDVERDRLVSLALSNIKDLKKTLSKWFLNSPFSEIDRQSIVGWLSFAFYSKHLDELTTDESQQIELFIEKIEKNYQIKPKENRNEKKLSCMKHILDPVRVIFRPFIFYFVTDTVLDRILCRNLFRWKNYQFFSFGQLQIWTYVDPSFDQTQQNQEDPIVFFHGIGAGLLFYQAFFSFLHKKFSRNRRLIFVSMPCISLRYPSVEKIPNIDETTEAIELIFKRFKLRKAIFIGHSYGTACLSWIVQKSPALISKLIFLDPICFALFEPYVVYNFVYRTPTKFAQLLMFYFVCREIGISYVVSRHFWWTQNNLYLEQIDQSTEKKFPIFVFLSEKDCIINPSLIRDYLTETRVQFHWAKHLFHGAFMFDKKSWQQISQWISMSNST